VAVISFFSAFAHPQFAMTFITKHWVDNMMKSVYFKKALEDMIDFIKTSGGEVGTKKYSFGILHKTKRS
jgi:hypothetical protein